jgi:hypothetical protein
LSNEAEANSAYNAYPGGVSPTADPDPNCFCLYDQDGNIVYHYSSCPVHG